MRGAHEAPKRHPRGTQEAFKRPPRRAASKRPPGGPQEAPKRHPRGTQDTPQADKQTQTNTEQTQKHHRQDTEKTHQTGPRQHIPKQTPRRNFTQLRGADTGSHKQARTYTNRRTQTQPDTDRHSHTQTAYRGRQGHTERHTYRQRQTTQTDALPVPLLRQVYKTGVSSRRNAHFWVRQGSHKGPTTKMCPRGTQEAPKRPPGDAEEAPPQNEPMRGRAPHGRFIILNL